MRIALLTCLPDNFLVCWLRSDLSRFFTGISRRKYGELISPMGNQRVGIFPPKSEILFVLSLALIWCRNFQDRTIPVGGDTWSSCTSERRISIRIIIGKKNKEINCSGLLLPVEYLRNGKRYSSSVFTFGYVQESRYKTVQPLSL